MDNTRHPAAPNNSSQRPGAALREVAARFDAWKEQRNEIAGQLRQIVISARDMLAQLGNAPAPGAPAPAVNKGGRPRGYRTSAATKAKLRAAWARRKALANGSAPAARSSASVTDSQGPRLRSTEARTGRAQGRRGAGSRKSAKK